MSAPSISLIVAVADSGVIGRGNALPWHLPDDLKRFKRLTLGKPVVMGRKTFESIGKPLPGRLNIVVTRDANYRRDGVTVVRSMDEALAAAAGVEEIMVIGGAELFSLFLAQAQRVHLTRVHGHIDGDVHWTPLDERVWHCSEAEDHAVDERHAFAMTFELWERIPESAQLLAMSESETTSATPSAASAEDVARMTSSRNAYAALDDLMVVVEALCPTWPARAPWPANAKLIL